MALPQIQVRRLDGTSGIDGHILAHKWLKMQTEADTCSLNVTPKGFTTTQGGRSVVGTRRSRIDMDFVMTHSVFYSFISVAFLFSASTLCLSHPSTRSVYAVLAAAIAWTFLSWPLEGRVLFQVTPDHGFTESDILSVAALGIAIRGALIVIHHRRHMESEQGSPDDNSAQHGIAIRVVFGRGGIERAWTPRIDRARWAVLPLVIVVLLTTLWGTSNFSRGDVEAARHHGFGFASINTLLNANDAEIETELTTMVDAGASWIRVVVLWQAVEPQPGVFDWDIPDRVIDAARRHGLNVLALISGPAPGWAHGLLPLSQLPGVPPADPATYGNFAGNVAAHYAGRVSAWEIWNEPNVPSFFSPMPDIGKYALMLKAAYLSIHAAQPTATVLSGGLSPSGGLAITPTAFLNQLYAAGAGLFLDGVALHPYTFPFGIDNDPNRAWDAIGGARLIMEKYGDSAKPIWITEFGAPTGTSNVAQSEDAQSALLTDAMRRAADLPYLGPTFIYTVRDNSADPSNSELNFGVVHNDYSRKPAFYAIQAFR
jgi:hypothetical protein